MLISLPYNYSDGTQFKCDLFRVKQLFELELIYIFLFFVINKLKINSESPQKTWDMLRYSERNRLINVQYKCQRINVPKTKPNVFFSKCFDEAALCFYHLFDILDGAKQFFWQINCKNSAVERNHFSLYLRFKISCDDDDDQYWLCVFFSMYTMGGRDRTGKK